MRIASRALATVGALAALGGSAFAANQLASTRDAPRPPAASTILSDAGGPLFNLQGMTPGQQAQRCITLTNTGPQPADVALYGVAGDAALAPYLHLNLVRGTEPDGSTPGDCSAFSADTNDYGAGGPGVVYDGTLAALPGDNAAIADPTRWSVGEHHSYELTVRMDGDDPQQGLSANESFQWGITPFDDRPPLPIPTPAPGTPGGTTPGTTPGAHQCTVVTFPSRDFIGARSITPSGKVLVSKTKQKKKLKGKAKGSSKKSVRIVAPAPLTLTPRQVALLGATKAKKHAATPILVARLSPGQGSKLAVKVALRRGKKGAIYVPHRWQWVKVRINSTPVTSLRSWPYTGSVSMTHLKTGFNQIDIELNRGRLTQRIKGYPRLLHRSLGFIVKQSAGAGTSDCVVG